MIHTKRIYKPAEPTDGFRILIDRLWPRGVTKEAARLDLWLKEIAPSTELRKWFHDASHAERWDEFKARYIEELKENAAVAELRDIIEKNEMVTFLFAANDEQQNHALVLKAFVENNSY